MNFKKFIYYGLSVLLVFETSPTSCKNINAFKAPNKHEVQNISTEKKSDFYRVSYVDNEISYEGENTYLLKLNSQKQFKNIKNNFKSNIIQISDSIRKTEKNNNLIEVKLNSNQLDELKSNKNVVLENNIYLKASNIEQKEDYVSDNEDNSTQSEYNDWNMQMMNVCECEKNRDIRVAVMDSGISPSSELNVEEWIDISDKNVTIEPMFQDLYGHGTSIAHIIGAAGKGNNIKGICPGVSLVSVKVLNDEGRASLSDVVEGIYWCINNNIDVINMSFGTDVDSEILHDAIKEAYENGITIVSACGNTGNDSLMEYPAAYEETISVGSVNSEACVSEFSSQGGYADILAPGELIPSVDEFDTKLLADGTSMAAAEVTGIIASILSKKSVSSDNIKDLLKESAYNIEGNRIVNMEEFINMSDNSQPANIESDENHEVFTSDSNANITTFSAVELNASWSVDDHINWNVDHDLNIYISLDSLYIIGLRLPDVHKNNINTSTTYYANVMNGMWNFVGNTMIWEKAAYMLNNNISITNINNLYIINDGTDSQTDGNNSAHRTVCWNYIKNNWSSIINDGSAINKTNKGKVMCGVAIHNAMDAYAHQAVIKKSNGEFYAIEGNHRDDTGFEKKRYDTAKQVAAKIYNQYVLNTLIDADVFCGNSCHETPTAGNSFYLKNFFEKAYRADSQTALSKQNWLKPRCVHPSWEACITK